MLQPTPSGSEFNTDSLFKGKYGNAYDDLRRLTQEIKRTCEKKKP
jgi:hypothetical protein